MELFVALFWNDSEPMPNLTLYYQKYGSRFCYKNVVQIKKVHKYLASHFYHFSSI